MKRSGVVLMVLLAGGPLAAQNLAANGGFETHSAVPTNYSQICYATEWTSPNSLCALVVGCGSPEYYSTLGSGGALAPSTFWATVAPHTGTGFAGFAPWYLTSPSFREYVRTSLTTPLVVGTTYTMSFWLTNGISTIHPYGINHLGVAFSTTPLVQSCGAQIVATPLWEVPGVTYSTGWQQFSFTFTATAAFQYLCIGNFVPFATTTYQYLGALGSSGSYYYIDDVVVQQAVVLPVELVDFSATLQDDRTVRLDWRTATELNNDRFTVERSADGGQFTPLFEVPGAGNSMTPLAYAGTDDHPEAGTNYYRLVQTDLDGSATISATRAVDVPGQRGHDLVVFPDPSEGVITVQWPANVVVAEVRILDLSGRMVRVEPVNIAGATQRVIDDLASGTYIVRACTSTGQCITARAVVER